MSGLWLHDFWFDLVNYSTTKERAEGDKSMAKLRRLVVDMLKTQSIFTFFVTCTALVFSGISNAQSIFVDNKVLETLGAPPNVASALLGKVPTLLDEKIAEKNYDSFSVAPFPAGIKKPQFPIIIKGKFYPPAGKISTYKISRWDPSLTAPPDNKLRIRTNSSQKKQGRISVIKPLSKASLKPKIVTKTELPLQPKSPVKLKKALKSKPETANTTASLAKAPVKTDKKPFTINFGIGTSNLNAQGQKTLGFIAGELKASEKSRVEVRAYASSSGVTESQARRLSLSRALAVRSSLIALGIRSTRIDVRALGSKGQTVPPDRVDLQIN